MLVRGLVVEHHVDELAGRHGGLDGVEEADELAMAMTLHAAAQHRAFQDVQRSEQRCGAVTDVVVGL